MCDQGIDENKNYLRMWWQLAFSVNLKKLKWLG